MDSIVSNMTNTSLSNNTSIWSLELTLLVGIDYVALAVAFLLHILGITLLLNSDTKELTNQSILLVHLSITSIFNLFTNSASVYYTSNIIRFTNIFIVSYYIFYMTYICTLILLTLDRLTFVILIEKYKAFLTRMKLTVSIVIAWLVSIVYIVIMIFNDLIQHKKFAKYSSFVYNGIVVLFTIVVYIFIIIKIKRSKKLSKSDHDQKNKSGIRKYIIPFLLVTTFFIFQVGPVIIQACVTIDKEDVQIKIILIGANILNFISDPLIYVFLQSAVRKTMYKYLVKVKLILCCSRE